MSEFETKDKFIAFVDILGFTHLVHELEQTSEGMARLVKLTKVLGENYWGDVPSFCPNSRRIATNLDLQVTQISDCVIISVETSPAGIVNLIQQCGAIAHHLLADGHLCRGFITRGRIYHQGMQVLGSGYMYAFKNESKVRFSLQKLDETGTPFIEVDQPVVDYIATSTDTCVRTMCGRATTSDGTYTAIYPFASLARIPATIVGAGFDPAKWQISVRRSLGFRRENLNVFATAENATPLEDAKAKIRHYKRGLEDVIRSLEQKDAALSEMISGKRAIPYGSVF